ncbi:MAG: META domain-containing protein [Methanoregula sp.]|nr:META domain-containing protein [Methanoregula sp.]
MRKFLVLLAFLVIAAVMITGCTTPQPAPQPAPATLPPTTVVMTPAPTPALPAQLAGNWIVTSMGIQDGTAVIKPQSSDITLSFADGTVSGNGGCNNYNGPFTLTGQTTPKGNGISIGPLVSTKMFCQEYSDQETMYLNILQKAAAYNVDGVQLSITASTGDVLIYQKPASLVTPEQFPHPA